MFDDTLRRTEFGRKSRIANSDAIIEMLINGGAASRRSMLTQDEANLILSPSAILAVKLDTFNA